MLDAGRLLTLAADHWESLASLLVLIGLLWLARWLLIGRIAKLDPEEKLPRLLILLTLTAAAMAVLVLILPISDATRGQLLGLIGIALTAIIALASTTFVANIMAGLMLRVVNSFKPGDYLRVEAYFGRVSERGLFHTEIQTEDGDLTTVPNLFIATHPVTVVRSTGTIISATVSLSYDLEHSRIEQLLTKAAERCGLTDPFVQVLELGDYCVNYRVAGKLLEVRTLLTARSRLRREMLDVLHGDGIEIVSPSFMNQRQLDPSEPILARPRTEPASRNGPTAEEVIFDKAIEAERREAMKSQLERLRQALESLAEETKSAEPETKASLEKREENLNRRIALLEQALSQEKSD